MSSENNNLSPQSKRLWKDYYICKKPRCLGCLEQGIAEEEYKFCSLKRTPVTIYDERGREIVHVFNDIYACNVYHWTIYQGPAHQTQFFKLLTNYKQAHQT